MKKSKFTGDTEIKHVVVNLPTFVRSDSSNSIKAASSPPSSARHRKSITDTELNEASVATNRSGRRRSSSGTIDVAKHLLMLRRIVWCPRTMSKHIAQLKQQKDVSNDSNMVEMPSMNDAIISCPDLGIKCISKIPDWNPKLNTLVSKFYQNRVGCASTHNFIVYEEKKLIAFKARMKLAAQDSVRTVNEAPEYMDEGRKETVMRNGSKLIPKLSLSSLMGKDKDDGVDSARSNPLSPRTPRYDEKSAAPGEKPVLNPESAIFQFGRCSEISEEYNLDFRFPISPLQAFAMAISSFADEIVDNYIAIAAYRKNKSKKKKSKAKLNANHIDSQLLSNVNSITTKNSMRTPPHTPRSINGANLSRQGSGSAGIEEGRSRRKSLKQMISGKDKEASVKDGASGGFHLFSNIFSMFSSNSRETPNTARSTGSGSGGTTPREDYAVSTDSINMTIPRPPPMGYDEPPSPYKMTRSSVPPAPPNPTTTVNCDASYPSNGLTVECTDNSVSGLFSPMSEESNTLQAPKSREGVSNINSMGSTESVGSEPGVDSVTPVGGGVRNIVISRPRVPSAASEGSDGSWSTGGNASLHAPARSRLGTGGSLSQSAPIRSVSNAVGNRNGGSSHVDDHALSRTSSGSSNASTLSASPQKKYQGTIFRPPSSPPVNPSNSTPPSTPITHSLKLDLSSVVSSGSNSPDVKSCASVSASAPASRMNKSASIRSNVNVFKPKKLTRDGAERVDPDSSSGLTETGKANTSHHFTTPISTPNKLGSNTPTVQDASYIRNNAIERPTTITSQPDMEPITPRVVGTV